VANLYSNENFPLPAVEELRRLGHDVLTLYETGRAGQAMPDVEVLAFARDEGRILITLNRKHFIRLHNQDNQHPGIIVCTFDPDFVALANRIHAGLEVQPQMAGQLIRVNRPSK
jgi:predicted nuclease of predicted toxin-antitoxin system